MKFNSINIKILSVVVITFVVTSIAVAWIADYQLKAMIDRDQEELLSEKVDAIIKVIKDKEERLQATMQVDVYKKDFQDTVVNTLRKSYYKKDNENFYPFIFSKEGTTVMHPTLATGHDSIKSYDFIRMFLADKGGIYYYDYNGVPKWCVIKYFEEWGWYVGYGMPISRKYEALYEIRDILLITMAVINLLAVCALAFAITKFMSPVAVLTEATTDIAYGNLDKDIDIKSSDEFGILTASFIKMRDSIREKIGELNVEISERKNAEKAIKKSEANLKITLDSIGDAVIAADDEGNIVRMNPVAENLTGWKLEEAKGKPLHKIFNIAESEEGTNQGLIEEVLTEGEVFSSGANINLLDRNGEPRLISYSGAPLRDPNGDILGLVLVFRDITETVRLEEQLRQSQKMESIGKLAGGIAHDFNNMLGGILGYSDILSRKVQDSTLKSYADQISVAATRAADLTNKLLAFSRKGKFISTSVDLHESIKSAIGLLERSIDRRIVLKNFLDAEDSVVLGDPAQLQNSILNLGVNSRDAMPDGGSITFKTENVYLDEVRCEATSFNIAPGEYIQVSIEDTGSGMEEGIKDHIFEPFFTTKEVGKGTGLGLAAVYGTVVDHNGAINVHSKQGQGTVFNIYLPLVKTLEGNGSIETSDPGEPSDSEQGTVLLVDDEEIIRSMGEALLEDMGYKVLFASNGREALEVYKEEYATIDFVILDMIMPEMNGRECFEEIHKFDPEAVVFISSGFTRDQGLEDLEINGLKGFIKKPYNVAQLRDILSRAVK